MHYAKFVHRLNSTSTNLLLTNSTNMNFIPTALKIVLVKFLLVETALVGDPLQLVLHNFTSITMITKKATLT